MSNSLLGRPKFQIGSFRSVFESGLWWLKSLSRKWRLQQPNFSKFAVILDYKRPGMLCQVIAKCWNWTFKMNFLCRKSFESIGISRQCGLHFRNKRNLANLKNSLIFNYNNCWHANSASFNFSFQFHLYYLPYLWVILHYPNFEPFWFFFHWGISF